MARPRQPSVATILRQLKCDPLREIAAKAMTLEEGSDERIKAMWELMPYVHYKAVPPKEELPTGAKSVTVIEFGSSQT